MQLILADDDGNVIQNFQIPKLSLMKNRGFEECNLKNRVEALDYLQEAIEWINSEDWYDLIQK